LTNFRHEQERLGSEVHLLASNQFVDVQDFLVKQNITTETIQYLITKKHLNVLSLDGTTDTQNMDWNHSYIYDPAILQELRKGILKTIRTADASEM
jgi:hypothetical protein